ncbi:hypothetical protein Vretimale_3285 [Volvox reticuliferus]|uniref:HORMA domain-containing protein n=1 Tax=Volvox reticuliferus TaxID=1737510 RepID=A0A8J4DET9_9CHLO|nr:hypothetical protein Vretimale_3285 [Volvox reticuliferus]
MKNLDDMHIKMLLPSCDESRRLIEWVEGGVYDAIKRGYLKNLFFGISTDPDGTELLEEYVFTFRYGDGDRVVMDVNAITTEGGVELGGKKRGKKSEFKQESPKADLNTVRYQVCRLIRMLVQVCRTLDKVPSERYLFMKLTYQDHTPEEYEPPYFIPVDESGIGHFKRAPFSMAVGRVATDHHTVSLKVKSTLDSCDDEFMDGEVAGEAIHDGVHHSGGGGTSHGCHGPAPTDRATAQAQPSEGSNGSGDAGIDDEVMTTEREEAGAAGGGGGGSDGGDAMTGVEEAGGKAGTPLAIEPTAAPSPDITDLMADSDAVGFPDAAAAQPPPPPPSPADVTVDVTKGGRSGGEMDMDAEGDGGPEAVTAAPSSCAHVAEEDDVTEAPEAEDYLALCEYIRGRSQVNLAHLARQFGSMSQGALAGYLDRLKGQGVLVAVPGARSRFRVITEALTTPHGPEAKHIEAQSATLKGDAGTGAGGAAGASIAPAAMTTAGGMANQGSVQRHSQGQESEDAAALIVKRLDGLSMDVTRGGATDAAAAGGGNGQTDNLATKNDLRRSRDQTERADGSRGGRLESAQAGDDLTGMADVEAASEKRLAGATAGAQPGLAADDPHVYIVDSQQSGLVRLRGGRVRKASYVADPIPQGALPKKAKTGPPAAVKAIGLSGAAGAPMHSGYKADKAAAPTPRGARSGSRLSGMRR